MNLTHPETTHDAVIIGAGNAGIALAARLRRDDPDLDVAIVSPTNRTPIARCFPTLVQGLRRCAGPSGLKAGRSRRDAPGIANRSSN